MSSDARLRPATSRRARPSAWLLVALVAATTCNKNTPDGATETPEPAGDAASGGASLESLERELAARNGELSQAADARRTAMSGNTEAPGADHCERICSIAEAICGLADSICALADEHTDEPRYAESCAGAKADCEHANEACDACEG